MQNFAPGTESLVCSYCQHTTDIPRSQLHIKEIPLDQAIYQLNQTRKHPAELPSTQVVNCNSCGAQFRFDQDIHSGECPYCGHAVVLGTAGEKLFKPQSLLAFKVTHDDAKKRFQLWLKGLWFAPAGLRKYIRKENKLKGIYLPYWTYDSDTTTHYSGERGDAYQEPRRVVQIVNGRRVARTIMVTRIRWTPVRGVVGQHFDDVLIGATNSIPRQISDQLAPWDLENLVPYKEEYLSGFGAQAYQVELDEGFGLARYRMEDIIRTDVAYDIGGDAQRIHQLKTQHANTTFKHLLLPVWSAGFRYKDKDYWFIVNARSGKVQGLRPYSRWKIGFTILSVTSLILVGLYLYGQSGGFELRGSASGFPSLPIEIFRF